MYFLKLFLFGCVLHFLDIRNKLRKWIIASLNLTHKSVLLQTADREFIASQGRKPCSDNFWGSRVNLGLCARECIHICELSPGLQWYLNLPCSKLSCVALLLQCFHGRQMLFEPQGKISRVKSPAHPSSCVQFFLGDQNSLLVLVMLRREETAESALDYFIVMSLIYFNRVPQSQ